MFLNAISELQNIKYSHWKTRYYGNRKTRFENVGFINVLEVSKWLLEGFPLHFSWIFMTCLNAISELQNIKYSNWKSRYYGSRETRSEIIGFINILEVSKWLLGRFPLHFSWLFMLFWNAIPELQNIKYSRWKTRYYGNRKTLSENVGFVNVLEVSKWLLGRFPLHFNWIFIMCLNVPTDHSKCWH